MGFWDDVEAAALSVLKEIDDAGGLVGLIAEARYDPAYATPVQTGDFYHHANEAVVHSINSVQHSQNEVISHQDAATHWDQAATQGDNAWDALQNGFAGNGFAGLGSSLKGMFGEVANAGEDTFSAMKSSYHASREADMAGKQADLAGNNPATAQYINNAMAGPVQVYTSGGSGVQNLTQVSLTQQISGMSSVGDFVEGNLDKVNNMITSGVSLAGRML